MLNLKYKKVIKILKNYGVGVMPTDTLYGLVGSAFSRKAINRIYKVKDRDKKKPFIVLISSLKDLEKFGISKHSLLSQKMFTLLQKAWPGKESIILSCKKNSIKKLKYLHRGENSIAFRFPKNKKLIEILKKTGPLVAPSANPEGLKPAENIKEAKAYFGDQVDFYLPGGTLKSEPSALIKIDDKGEIKVLRGTIKYNYGK